MRTKTVLIFWNLVIVSVLVFPPTSGNERDENCIETMSTCQPEREKLSSASLTNKTIELCSALQVYSDCMTPRVDECPGEAMRAFSVVISTYTREPYNCHLRGSHHPETAKEESKNQDSNAINPSAHGADDDNHSQQEPYAVDVLEPIPKEAETSHNGADETVTRTTTAAHIGPTKKAFSPSNSSARTSLTIFVTIISFLHLFLYC